MTTPKQQYTVEFKQEAVRLLQSTGKSSAQRFMSQDAH